MTSKATTEERIKFIYSEIRLKDIELEEQHTSDRIEGMSGHQLHPTINWDSFMVVIKLKKFDLQTTSKQYCEHVQ